MLMKKPQVRTFLKRELFFYLLKPFKPHFVPHSITVDQVDRDEVCNSDSEIRFVSYSYIKTHIYIFLNSKEFFKSERHQLKLIRGLPIF